MAGTEIVSFKLSVSDNTGTSMSVVREGDRFTLEYDNYGTNQRVDLGGYRGMVEFSKKLSLLLGDR